MLKVLRHKSQWKPTFIFKFLLFFTWQNYYYLFQTFLEIQPKPAETWKVLEQLMFQCAKSLITAIFHLKGWRTSLFIFLPFCTLVSKRVCSCILDYVCVARRIYFFFFSKFLRHCAPWYAHARPGGGASYRKTRAPLNPLILFSQIFAHIHIQRCLSSGTRLLSFICRF